jgi:PEP-CTERM motif
MRSSRLFVFLVATLLMLGAAQVASADTVGSLNLGASNWNASGDLATSGGTSGTWTLTFSFTNGTANTVDLNSFGVQLFNAGSGESFTIGTGTVNGSTISGTAWEAFSDTKLNNGSSPSCSGNTNMGWLCADTAGLGTLSPYSILSGQSAAFVFTGTYSNTSAIGTLDLMASGCLVAGTCVLDGGSSNGNKWAVSAPMGSGGTSVPEPRTFSLLAIGLLGLAASRKLVLA